MIFESLAYSPEFIPWEVDVAKCSDEGKIKVLSFIYLLKNALLLDCHQLLTMSYMYRYRYSARSFGVEPIMSPCKLSECKTSNIHCFVKRERCHRMFSVPFPRQPLSKLLSKQLLVCNLAEKYGATWEKGD